MIRSYPMLARNAGLHNFSLFVGRPEIASPYTRLLVATVSGYTSNAEYREFTHKANFIIQGLYKDGDGLSFALPSHSPIMVLRDPPGGTSFSTFANVQTKLSIIAKEKTDTVDNEISGGLANNYGLKGQTCFGLGVMICTEEEIGATLTLFETSIKVGGRVKYWKNDRTLSRTITWTYQTSTDPWLAGTMSDVFAGKCLCILLLLSIQTNLITVTHCSPP